MHSTNLFSFWPKKRHSIGGGGGLESLIVVVSSSVDLQTCWPVRKGGRSGGGCPRLGQQESFKWPLKGAGLKSRMAQPTTNNQQRQRVHPPKSLHVFNICLVFNKKISIRFYAVAFLAMALICQLLLLQHQLQLQLQPWLRFMCSQLLIEFFFLCLRSHALLVFLKF